MNFNYQIARELMVENQLRPNKITDPIILDLFKRTKKEDFLSETIKAISYSDLDINLNQNRGYLKNLHVAQLITFANINSSQKVLHIGGMTGYVSSMLAHLCKELIIIENQENFLFDLKKNMQELNFKNVKIFNSEFDKGFNGESPYDVIFIDTPIENISNIIKDQLSDKAGKIILIKITQNNLCKAYKITKNKNNYANEYLFDVFSKYRLCKKKVEFVF